MTDSTTPTVVATRPAPEPHHDDCMHGCSHGAARIFGACRQQCVKTAEFEEQSAREAQSSRVRFSRQIIRLHAAGPPPAAALTVRDWVTLLVTVAAFAAWLAAVACWLGSLA